VLAIDQGAADAVPFWHLDGIFADFSVGGRSGLDAAEAESDKAMLVAKPTKIHVAGGL
jgi:hypothetical protein